MSSSIISLKPEDIYTPKGLKKFEQERLEELIGRLDPNAIKCAKCGKWMQQNDVHYNWTEYGRKYVCCKNCFRANGKW